MLLLVCFYLFHLVRGASSFLALVAISDELRFSVPWEMYYDSRSRRILKMTMLDEDDSPESIEYFRERQEAVHKLERTEMISLAMTVLAPVVGAYFLFFARGMLSDPDRYINRFTISLFSLATAVKPLLHLSELVKRRSLYYQEVVHYPSTRVHYLHQKIDALSSQLAQLNQAYATKDALREFQEKLDKPVSALAKSVRKYERKEEFARLSSEERFALLDAKLEEATREVYVNAQLVEQLKQEYDAASHPITTILRVVNHMMGARYQDQNGGKRQNRLRWWNSGPMFYILLPLNLPTMAVEWAAMKAIKATETR